jgi:two-component system, OmpR family, alkaline phosphatase synthesis response regulator PhoP
VSVVLLIDDEPGMGSLVSMSLEDAGARVVQVDDLAAALAAAREERPSVVLLDLALGSEDGLSLLPRLREEPSLSDVPIIAFTIHESRQREALEKGADGFVAKPFRAAELHQVLEEHIGGD